MGVETPIPPFVMNAAAPDGAPLRRIENIGEYFFAIEIKLPCPAVPYRGPDAGNHLKNMDLFAYFHGLGESPERLM